jgi:hypothetical protein
MSLREDAGDRLRWNPKQQKGSLGKNLLCSRGTLADLARRNSLSLMRVSESE